MRTDTHFHCGPLARNDLVQRLLEVGIPAELHVYPGAFHAFNALPGEPTRQFNDALRTVLKNAFAFAKA